MKESIDVEGHPPALTVLSLVISLSSDIVYRDDRNLIFYTEVDFLGETLTIIYSNLHLRKQPRHKYSHCGGLLK